MKKVAALLTGDLINISRDLILVMSMIAPVILMIFLNYGLPFFNNIFEREFNISLTVYYPLITSIFFLFIPIMLGMLTGFMLLDERDEKILLYLSVTPLSRARYLFYRLVSPVIISFFLSIIFLNNMEIIKINTLNTIPILLLAAFEAPIMTLFLGAFAGNKVEGLAFSKGMGLLLFAPLVGYFLESSWQYAAGVIPTFWISKAFLSGSTRAYWVYIGIGFVIHLLYFSLVFKKFKNRVG